MAANKCPVLKGQISRSGSDVQAAGLTTFRSGDATSGVAGFGNLQFASSKYRAIAQAQGAAAALLAAWQALDENVLSALRGDYAVVCWRRDAESGSDSGRTNGLIAVDQFATHSLFWAEHAGTLGFSTHPVDVPGLFGHAPQLDPNALHAYAYFHVIPAPLSICADVQRLDCGEAVRLKNGRHERFTHWRPAFVEDRPFDFPAQKRAFLNVVREGVASSAATTDPSQIGCFLSGGTDSSTIAGMFGQAFNQPAKTFSIVFEEARYDESDYSRLASRHFGTAHTEHVLTPAEVLDTISTISRVYEQPFGNSSAVPSHVCAGIAAQHGVTRMLGGDGGDELYGGNTRYAKAWKLSLYGNLPHAMRTQMLEPLADLGMANNQFFPIRKFKGYVDQARVELPEQVFGRYNLLNRLGYENVFAQGIRAAMNGFDPAALEREVWSREQEASLINRLLAYDFKFTLGDNDLPKVTRMCHAAGVSVGFPMLSDGVLEHSLQLRPNQKLKRTELRHFFRKALRGFLPDEIIDKSKHGFGMPFGEWLLSQPELAALADDALQSLQNRGVIRPEFTSEIRSRLASGHAGYFGTMVWVLMILELWLRESPFADIRWQP